MKLYCHCENIKVEVAKPEQVTSCNCSICSRYQALWGYYKPDEVEISIGSAGEKCYSWGDNEIAFVHCKNCGCVVYYRTVAGSPEPRVAINFRMIDETIAKEIPICFFNGKELL
ncbi:GFA family protein [Zooshikella ganghwensis]|uniref:GFA family protein n=1 Tax=Zooshikella ganghwensis TaxID=202772 RepID=UPI000425DD26|nr:aldehyde-activating protein [Zooshikella ganghwensis]